MEILSHRQQVPSEEQEPNNPDVGWTAKPQTQSLWPSKLPLCTSASTVHVSVLNITMICGW